MNEWMLGRQAVRSGYMDSEYLILLGHRGSQVGILRGYPSGLCVACLVPSTCPVEGGWQVWHMCSLLDRVQGLPNSVLLLGPRTHFLCKGWCLPQRGSHCKGRSRVPPSKWVLNKCLWVKVSTCWGWGGALPRAISQLGSSAPDLASPPGCPWIEVPASLVTQLRGRIWGPGVP